MSFVPTSHLVIPRTSRKCVLWEGREELGACGQLFVPCWEHPTPPPTQATPKGGGVCWWSSSFNRLPLSLLPLKQWLLLVLPLCHHSAAFTFNFLLTAPPPSITSYSICAPPPTPHAPQPCYDDACLPIASNAHRQLKCFVSLVSKCIDLPIGSGCRSHLHSNGNTVSNQGR